MLLREGRREHHLYLQPFIRSDQLVRLLTSPAGSAIEANTNTGPNHTAAVIVRNREWWNTHPSGRNDRLEIGTKSPSQGDQPPVHILQNVTGNGSIGIHVHDDAATPGETTLNLLPFFPTQPFQTGVDVFMPATDPPDGTISFNNAPRGDTTRPQVLNTPNWASSEHAMSVFFNDYVQDINTWAQCKRVKPGPC